LNELKVGLLTLAAIASLVVVSLKITANKSGFGEYIEYRTILNDASGIYENSSIKVAGIVAGRIKTIDLSGSQALIKFEVLKQIKVTRFSVLRIKTVGFLGDKYLDIYLGNPEAPRLKEGAMIAAEAGAGFEELGKDASEILKDVKEIAKAIRESLYDENKRNVVKDIVGSVRDFSKNAKDISESLKRLAEGNEKKISDTLDDIKRLSSQLAYETDRYADGSFMNDLDGIKPIIKNVNKAVADLKDIVADVKSGKGTVGKLLRDEEVIDQVNETLSGVNRLMNRVNNFKTDVSLFAGFNSNNASRTEFDLDLIPSPERLFRLGVVASDYGRNPYEETKRTTTTGSSSTETTLREEDVTAYRFNLQIGRRLDNWLFRGGIIESSGGLGVDYIMPDRGFRATLETFNFDQDLGPFVRLATEVRLWSVMYAKISGEDLASKDNNQSYTVSAGLRFNDEDLAALLGILAN
jgi:phospholipid/cholesterol/gamma-HCH transport system substrate-binding protein